MDLNSFLQYFAVKFDSAKYRYFELGCREISQSKFAQQIGVKPSLLNEIIKGKRGVNTEMALILEAALGIPAKFWINLQNEYNLQKAKSDESFMSMLASIRKIAAIL